MPIVKKPAAGWKFKRATNASRGNAARRVPEAPGDQPEQAAPGHPHPGNADRADRARQARDLRGYSTAARPLLRHVSAVLAQPATNL